MQSYARRPARSSRAGRSEFLAAVKQVSVKSRESWAAMTISIDANLLLSYYDLKAGVPSTLSSGSGSTSVGTPAPQVTPWAKAATTVQTNKLVQSVLNGQSFFNPGATKLSIPTTTPNYANTKQLFTLYQGLTALQDLATQANATGVSSFQASQLQSAFSKGMQQLQAYLNGQPFNGFSVAEGTVAASAQTTASVATETDTYTTGVLWSGDPNTPVPAFQGNVQFSLTVTPQAPAGLNANITAPNSPPVVVNFNLNDMGSTPRTMSNVVSYLNSQLQAAGVFTRFADVLTQGTSSSFQVNGQTITNPTGPNTYSLQVVGDAVESLSFSAPAPAAAIYLTQTAGAQPTLTTTASGNTTSGGTASGNLTVSQQLLKLTTDPTATSARVFTDTLGKTVQNAIATAASSDGSVYVLANVTGATQAGQLDASHGLAGTQDVALMKYDSAGNLIWTQTLGSTASASGLGLTVSADGSQVAVVGQGTGLLNNAGGPPADATDPTGFISVYDAQGDQQWSQSVNAWTAGQVNDVAFGADGSVYVAGSTQIASGLSDGYLAGFSASGAQTFNSYLGVTTTGCVTGIAVSNGQLVTAGLQNGDVVVQSYALQTTGAPTLTATRDLGAVGQGSVAGVAINSDGSVVVAGSTNNGSLSVATVGSAYAGGEEAFVATLAPSLSPSTSDTLAYFTGPADTTATAVTVAGGQVYITGQIVAQPDPSSGLLTASDGYAAQIDPATGQVTWSNIINSADNESQPNSIAVDPAGASALDALGLPRGTISFTPNQTLLANSSLQAGEQFYVKSNFNPMPQLVTVSATDTLQSLAQKITQASGYSASVTVQPTATGEALQIKSNSPSFQITLEAGPAGKNALPALGLSEGLITTNATAKAKSATSTGGAKPTTSLQANYALGLESNLSLTSQSNITNALAQLGGAINTVKSIYSNMTTAPSAQANGVNDPVPAYLTAEIANYQAALVRLTGGTTG
jgi:hypothetical protein